MNKNFWKTAICSGFALSCCLLTHPESARAEFEELIPDTTSHDALLGNTPLNFQRGKGGGGGGGGKSGGGGGGEKSGGGARSGGGGGEKSGGARPGGGGGEKSGGARPGGGGGIHVPSVSVPRGNAGHSGHPPAANRTPSFTRPGSIGLATRPPGHAISQIGNALNHSGLPGNNRPGAGASHIGKPGSISGIQRPSSGNRIGTENNILSRNLGGLNNQLNNATRGVPRLGGGHSTIGNRPFTGNNLSLGNRNFNIGSNQYRPSYYRHSGYHGYWNGNRGSSLGYGLGSALAYGLGSSLGGRNGGYGNGGYGNGGFGGYGNAAYGNAAYGNAGYGNAGYGNGWGWGLRRGNGRYRSYGGYGYRPLGWGLGGWGLGSLIYNSGYLGYSNPYYANNSSAVYNYSLPVPVSYAATTVVPENGVSSSAQVLDDAVLAFQQNDYDRALDITNKGIAQYPDDAVLHEFRSLVLFANQDYQQSAATIHSVLAVGPGWDWTTLSGIYADVSLYTVQLRALEAFTKSNPQDAASQFLLAYHYMSCGHPDAAARHFQQVVTLMPNDQVASDLARMLTPPEPASTTPGVPKVAAPGPGDEPAGPVATPIDPKSLIGVWKASRDDGSQFGLTITADAKFTWSFTPKGQAAQGFGGTYTVEENVLALERQDGGSLIAEITPGDAGNFNFRMLGAPEADQGLNFSK